MDFPPTSRRFLYTFYYMGIPAKLELSERANHSSLVSLKTAHSQDALVNANMEPAQYHLTQTTNEVTSAGIAAM